MWDWRASVTDEVVDPVRAVAGWVQHTVYSVNGTAAEGVLRRDEWEAAEIGAVAKLGRAGRKRPVASGIQVDRVAHREAGRHGRQRDDVQAVGHDHSLLSDAVGRPGGEDCWLCVRDVCPLW